MTGYLRCREIESAATQVIPSVQPTTPAKEVVVTLKFHLDSGPTQQATIVSDPIMLGLRATKNSSNFSKGAVITNNGIYASFEVEENYPTPLLSVATDHGVVNVPLSRWAPDKELLEERLKVALEEVNERDKTIAKLQKQVDQIPNLQAALASAENWLKMGGEAFHISGDPAIWMVVGKSRAWCANMEWDSRGLCVPTRDEFATLPIFSKAPGKSIGIITVNRP